MSQYFENVLKTNDLEEILQNEKVIYNLEKAKNENIANIYFSLNLSDSVKQTLFEKLNLNLFSISEIPMRIIKGDLPSHKDVSSSNFENTYLIYLSDSSGTFIIDNSSFEIKQNAAIVFNEGLNHETKNTDLKPRLILGPLNEQGKAVGAAVIYYFSNYNDAYNFNFGSELGFTNSTIVGAVDSGTTGGFTSWRIANSYYPFDSNMIYNNGDSIGGFGNALYPNLPCFLEGTKVLCLEEDKGVYKKVEDLRKDDLVKTKENGYKKVVLIGKKIMKNPQGKERLENKLYKLSKKAYKDLNEDLFVTGCHSRLVSSLTEKQIQNIQEQYKKIYMTENLYRLMAIVDEDAEPVEEEGEYTVWHFALENEDQYMNYGVFVNGVLLSETCSIRFMRDLSNLELI